MLYTLCFRIMKSFKLFSFFPIYEQWYNGIWIPVGKVKVRIVKIFYYCNKLLSVKFYMLFLIHLIWSYFQSIVCYQILNQFQSISINLEFVNNCFHAPKGQYCSDKWEYDFISWLKKSCVSMWYIYFAGFLCSTDILNRYILCRVVSCK